MKSAARLLIIVMFVVSSAGCSMFRSNISEQNPETASTLTAGYDQRDLLNWADMITQDILSHPFPSPEEQDSIMVVMGIENRSRNHIDTKAITDTMTTKMLNTTQLRFVNEARRDDLLKEQGYQLANATKETRTAIGKQLGAKYMVTGSLVEIGSSSGREVRISKKQDTYFQLTVEITDLETGLIVLRKQRDRLRRASKPLIGW
ncbi:MAG: hypothetical protein O3C57_02005 [Verrucomicrobia bacterium]|nr:hypothetical protein [Verrucomicrobiota bacterium]